MALAAARTSAGRKARLQKAISGLLSLEGTIKDLLKCIREAGVALVEDRGIPGRYLETPVSRPLTDLLQAHSFVDRPADPCVPGVVGTEALRQPGRVPCRIPEPPPYFRP
jgi:hypothetical protein